MGGVSATKLAKLATTVVYQRLETPTDRVDVIGKLIEGKYDEEKPMGRPELGAERSIRIRVISVNIYIRHQKRQRPHQHVLGEAGQGGSLVGEDSLDRAGKSLKEKRDPWEEYEDSWNTPVASMVPGGTRSCYRGALKVRRWTR